MGRLINQKYALVHIGQTVEEFLERANVLKRSQVGFYDKRMRFAALDIQAVQQFGSDVISLPKHGLNVGQLARTVGNEVNEHRSATPSGCDRGS